MTDECERDTDFAWCHYHECPLVEVADIETCLSQLGVGEYDGPMRRMFMTAYDIRRDRDDFESEIQGHECDHEECLHPDALEDEIVNHYKGWLKEVIETGKVPEAAKSHMLFHPY